MMVVGTMANDSFWMATLPAGAYAGVDMSEVYAFLDRQGGA